MSHSKPVLNLSAYKFIPLEDLLQIKAALLHLCNTHSMKGTILLSSEGININLSGEIENAQRLQEEFKKIDWLSDITFKESLSEEIPFNRMLVRLKKEIIAFGQEGIDPLHEPAPYITPKELEEWYNSGKDFAILDTRNIYETRVGTFENAIDPNLNTFREFPEYVKTLDDSLKDKPIVTFCTGGVRCEKAAPYLLEAGFKHVYQLDGGILKYLEEFGDNHYKGDCFVFDKRVALNAQLEPTGMIQCYRCRNPLTEEEVKSPKYELDVCCPHCYDRNGPVKEHGSLSSAATSKPQDAPSSAL